MTDTTVTTEAPTTPPPPTPLPNDAAARSPTGEILEPSQIQATPKPTTESKSADGTPDETSTSKDPKAPDAPKVPDAYEFKAPDGYTLDPKAVEAATPIFKELGLSQDAAQKLVDFYSKQMIDAAKAPAQEYESTRTAWKAQVDADPQIKGAVLDGKTGIEAVKVGIAKTLAAIGDPQLTQDFKAAMDLTGVGDNPAFIKAMWKLSAFVTEGTHVQGAKPSPHGQVAPGTSERPSAAKSLYPNLG